MLFTASVIALLALLAMILFYYRKTILNMLPSSASDPLRAGYTRLSTFSNQAASGLTSSNFDLESSNLDPLAGDSRVGLDEAGAREVHDIMNRQGVSFDEARLIRHKRILQQHGIDPSGMPLDSKAVTRL